MRISDWSSDVCSSDLDIVAEQQARRETGRRGLVAGVVAVGEQAARHEAPAFIEGIIAPTDRRGEEVGEVVADLAEDRDLRQVVRNVGVIGRIGSKEIGRASCRERVCKYV